MSDAVGRAEKIVCIYGLYGEDGCLRYIGKANDPKKRLDSHMKAAKSRKTPLYAWIRRHGRPEMRVLEANCADWREAERRLIAAARMAGERLLNLADGGDQPLCTREQRQANSVRMQNHPNTVAQRKLNAQRLNRKLREARNADPFLYARHSFLREFGQFVRFFEKSGNLERAEKLKKTMALARDMDPELLAYKLIFIPKMHKHFPEYLRAEIAQEAQHGKGH
jgi:hypothetical protein